MRILCSLTIATISVIGFLSAQTFPPPTKQYADCPVDGYYDCALCTDADCNSFTCRWQRVKCYWHSVAVHIASDWAENRCEKEENTEEQNGKLAAAFELLLSTPYFDKEEIDSVDFRFCSRVVSGTAITISKSQVLLSMDKAEDDVEDLATTLAHELWHCRQYADLGESHFRCLYANELKVGNGLAIGNCLEDPAYAFGVKVYKCITDGDCDDP